jgi:hypothetical protein
MLANRTTSSTRQLAGLQAQSLVLPVSHGASASKTSRVYGNRLQYANSKPCLVRKLGRSLSRDPKAGAPYMMVNSNGYEGPTMSSGAHNACIAVADETRMFLNLQHPTATNAHHNAACSLHAQQCFHEHIRHMSRACWPPCTRHLQGTHTSAATNQPTCSLHHMHTWPQAECTDANRR